MQGNFHKWAILYASNTWPWLEAPSPYSARQTPLFPLYLHANATPAPNGTFIIGNKKRGVIQYRIQNERPRCKQRWTESLTFLSFTRNFIVSLLKLIRFLVNGCAICVSSTVTHFLVYSISIASRKRCTSQICDNWFSIMMHINVSPVLCE